MENSTRRKSASLLKRSRLEIRAARAADHPELLRLIKAYYAFDHIRFTPRIVAPALAKLLRNKALGRVWIICDGATAIGYVVLTFNYDLEFGGTEGLVTDLYLDAAYRGSGFGRRALEVVDDYCRANGIGTVELQVENDNADAREFYRRIGFTQLSRVVMTRAVRRRARNTGRTAARR